MKHKLILVVFGLVLLASLLIVLIFVIVFMSFMGSPLHWQSHNNSLKMFTQSFENIPLAPQSQQVGETYSEFGLMSNSNHCDYYVSKLIQTSSPKPTLENYYNQFSIPPVNPNEYMMDDETLRGDLPNYLNVSQPWKEPDLMGPHSNDKDMRTMHKIESSLLTDDVYLISVLDNGYYPNDPRCH